MADDGILPLALLAGVGYLAWKYWSQPAAVSAAAPSSTSPSYSTTPSAATQPQAPTRNAYYTPAMTAPGPPAAGRPATNPYWNPSGSQATGTTSDTPMPDMTHAFDKPGLIDTNPVYNPPAVAAMTPEQLSFQARCTYIDGNWKPGCV